MTEDLEIRRYRPSDADRVWAVHERALRASAVAFVDDASIDEDLTRISDCYLDADGEFLVGLANDEIVAIGGFQPRGDDIVEIRRIRVHPTHQRRGYGERLLKRLEERARDQGFDRIVLDTNRRLTAARELYESRGYEETHRETHPGNGAEFVHYQKEL